MKQCYSGTGANTTANVLSYLNGTPKPLIRNLFIIGPPESPYALFLTDHEAPLSYALYPQQNFSPAVVKRGDIPCKIGLDSDSVSLTWSPGPATYSNVVGSANPRTLAQQGFYDNWPVLMLAGFMPTPGDVNTLGCTVLFKGIIAETTVDRKEIAWTVNSLMVLLDQQVPTNVIEATNSLANYLAASPIPGYGSVPTMDTFAGSTPNVLLAKVHGDSGVFFGTNSTQAGWVIFIPGPGATLPGLWSAIAANSSPTIGGVRYNEFQLYSPLPWSPTPYVSGSGDQFIVSAPVPTTGGYSFLYVPAPEQAL